MLQIKLMIALEEIEQGLYGTGIQGAEKKTIPCTSYIVENKIESRGICYRPGHRASRVQVVTDYRGRS